MTLPPTLYTATEASRYLGITPRAVKNAALRGELQAVRLGYRTVRYTAEALHEYVERKRRGPGLAAAAAQREGVTREYEVKPTNSRVRRAPEVS